MTNREISKQLYSAFATGDRATVLTLLHPDIVWIQNEGFPHGGTHTGTTAVLEDVLAPLRGEWSAWRAEVTEWLDAGEAVIALGEYRGTHAVTGRSMRAAFAHVLRIDSGRIIRFQQFADTHQVHTALPPCA